MPHHKYPKFICMLFCTLILKLWRGNILTAPVTFALSWGSSSLFTYECLSPKQKQKKKKKEWGRPISKTLISTSHYIFYSMWLTWYSQAVLLMWLTWYWKYFLIIISSTNRRTPRAAIAPSMTRAIISGTCGTGTTTVFWTGLVSTVIELTDVQDIGGPDAPLMLDRLNVNKINCNSHLCFKLITTTI